MDPVFNIMISICMCLLFGVAAIHKLKAPAKFRAAMDNYQLLPQGLSGLMSMLLITMELGAAAAVLVPVTRATGLGVMAILLIVYTAGIGINLYRGRREIDCGCSGPASRHELSGWLVLRNLVLLGLVLFALGPAAERSLNWLDLLTVIFGAAVASGLYMGLNQLLAQAPRLASLRSGG